MTKSPRNNVPDVGIELGAACMPSGHASDRATAPGAITGLRSMIVALPRLLIEPCHGIMVLSVLHKPILQTHMRSGARCLMFGCTLRLLPYFMCTKSKGSGETARMRRLAWAIAGRICDKYHNLMIMWCTQLHHNIFVTLFLGCKLISVLAIQTVLYRKYNA